ncbi:MAG: hypothetical protein HC859_01975 [Bacteroidia bacterium]|nr:hypothetical protein [Bacteroidia bacterium]
MKQLTTLCLFLFVASGATAQALQDINYNYQYDPNQSFAFSWKVIHQPERWTVLFRLESKDTLKADASKFVIVWEGRQAIGDKTGDTLDIDKISPVVNVSNKKVRSGSLVISSADAPPILVAKVVSLEAKQAWLHYEILDPEHFEKFFLVKDGVPDRLTSS